MADSQTESTNDVLELIAKDYLKEKRNKRRWGIFFKLVFVGLIALAIYSVIPSKKSMALKNKPHAALIDIKGTIFSGAKASADNIVTSLRRAYKDKGTKGIILRINSPGGSPVQADYVFTEIMRLRKLHPKIKVYAVCTDMCASAAYYIAAAADDIYANQASLVGSIGVLYNGFGFVDGMQKVGVTRRLITAGKYKGFMDPFSKVQPGAETRLKGMLENIHQRFEAQVELGRGKRLKRDPDIFSGLFWTGSDALPLGLIDGFSSPGNVAKNILKVKRIENYTVKPNFIKQLSKKFGAEVTDMFLSKFGFDNHQIESRI